jgi:hypothetical protein
MSLQNTQPSRRRGAPTGNKNAVKHGFYSTKFKKSERTALDESEFSGLSQEIALLRLYIRRVVARSVHIDDFYEDLEVLRVLSVAFSSLSRLVRAHALLASSGESEIAQALHEALEDVHAEIEKGEFPSWPVYVNPRVSEPTDKPVEPKNI